VRVSGPLSAQSWCASPRLAALVFAAREDRTT
jgi:hypothetical protein